MADLAPSPQSIHLRPSPSASAHSSRSWLGTSSPSSPGTNSAAAASTSPPTSAYTASLPPTYRRSSFPISPAPSSCLNGTTDSNDLASCGALLLPPGLALQQHGCGDDTSADAGFCGGGGDGKDGRTRWVSFDTATVAAGDAASTSGPSSRKSSSSSFDSCADSCSTAGSGTATPLSSLAGSVLSLDDAHHHPSSSSPSTSSSKPSSLLSALDWSLPPLSPSAPSPRSLSLSTGSDEIAKKKQRQSESQTKTGKSNREERESAAVKGGWEDPALARARRALWEDVPVEVVQTGGTAAAVFVEEEEGEEGEEGDEEEGEEEEDDWQLPPARPDAASSSSSSSSSNATTTAPLYSCLRTSSLSRSFASLSCSTTSTSSSPSSSPSPSSPSSSSLCLSTTPSSCSSSRGGGSSSVTFAPTPTTSTCLTYSPLAYPRGGHQPVEKLSIREWMELQGVREAVGVWSGRVGTWEEVRAAMEGEEREARERALGLGGGEKRGRPACSRLQGVVQIARSTPSSPVEACRGLPDV
ncbi:hypothetical protein JCM6882_002258 [Rhodosporidiobolus microsporus]